MMSYHGVWVTLFFFIGMCSTEPQKAMTEQKQNGSFGY